MNRNLKYALCGIIGIGGLIATPFAPIVAVCLAEGNHNREESAGGASGGYGRNGGWGFDSRGAFTTNGTCCFGGTSVSDFFNRLITDANRNIGTPFYRAQTYSAFFHDAMHAAGWDKPAMRGDWTVGGYGAGQVSVEMRGPGGTIGPI